MEITIISEETVKVLDRYVFAGAGKFAIRCLFAAICLLILNEIWDFTPKLWIAAKWLGSAKGLQDILSVWNSKTLNALLALAALLFILAAGAAVTTTALEGLAWAWRSPRIATEQIRLAWRETPPSRRALYVATLGFVASMLILAFFTAMMFIAANAKTYL